MQIDALALRLRPRTPYEAADLGTRLCQSAARDVYKCYLAIAIPVYLLCMCTVEIAYWFPALAVYWLKPWLDRTILYRAVARGVWSAYDVVRLVGRAAARVVGPALHHAYLATAVAVAFVHAAGVSARGVAIRAVSKAHPADPAQAFGAGGVHDVRLQALRDQPHGAVGSLLYWFAPRGQAPDLGDVHLAGRVASRADLRGRYGYRGAVPRAVLRRFGVRDVSHRRAELEAWDIEQEFRRAFPQ